MTWNAARLENGILTTAATSGSAGAISPGCEAQFKLGIYRINKRIRERRYPLIDVERGVVVSTGFFDHANEFDRYKLTDGREMKTALKWPNSISLIEAFKVRDSKIYRIEAVFSYVPHRMHNPFYFYPPAPAAQPEDAATLKERCDKACLLALGDRFMTAFASQKPDDVPWARNVRFTENGVGIPVGEGIWGSIRSKSDTALRVADPVAGTYTWYGLIYDHDAPAWAGVRLKATGAHVGEVEVIVARERNPGPWGDPKKIRSRCAIRVGGACGPAQFAQATHRRGPGLCGLGAAQRWNACTRASIQAARALKMAWWFPRARWDPSDW